MGRKISSVFMYSGQGSHYYQMGKQLFESETLFRSEMLAADKLYYSLSGLSIIDTLFASSNKISDLFTSTILTHPAIFIVQCAMTKLLIANGIVPDYVLGASVGEFAAAVACGILCFEEGLLAVYKQAQILEKRCPAGTMIAVLSSPDLYNHPCICQNSELASVNFRTHFVISGGQSNMKYIEGFLKKEEIPHQILAVSQGFHSACIDPAADEFLRFIPSLAINTPKIPYLSASSCSSITPEHFWQCVRLPIHFQLTIEKMQTKGTFHFIDIGPSGTLATFVKYILGPNSESKAHTTLTPLKTTFELNL